MKRLLGLLVCGVMLSAAEAPAATLVGEFDLVGLGGVRVYPTIIDWGTATGMFGPANGDILFVLGEDVNPNVFEPGAVYALPGTMGELRDLSLMTAPVGVPFALPNFLTSDAHPELNFTLTFIAPGSGSPSQCGNADGQVCTPMLAPGVKSPFTITNTDGGSSVALRLRGIVSDGTADPVADWIGTWTTQFAELTAGELLAMLDDEMTGYVQSSYSANVIVTPGGGDVPEPASMLLTGLALSGLALALRRRPRA